MTIQSMGDLRKFLAETMQGVRDGTVDAGAAGQVAKLAAQINASIHAEIAARAHLKVESRSFNDLALIAAPEEVKPQESEEGDSNEADEDPKAEWYPNDWPHIQQLLARGKAKEEIADEYGVSMGQLQGFIEEKTEGEVQAPAKVGA